MSQQALYRKWRSSTFDEIVGQPHIVQTLQNALETDRVVHAYLFSGPRGTGKTSSARILAKVINCLAPEGERPCNECHICQSINDGSSLDLIEIDAASNTQVDKVRDVIVEKVNFAPSEARKKVYIIDEVHMLSNSAFNALLKTIEEPPPHAMFVLATTEIHKIPATVLSRCQRLDFRRISVEEIAGHLAWVLEQEGIRAEPEVLDLVARQATGSMRDALSLLDQLLAHGGTHLTVAQARAALGLASTETVQALVDYLLAQEVGEALQLVNRLLDQGTDPRQFLVDVLEQMRVLLLTLAGGDRQLLNLPEEALARLREQRKHMEPAVLVEMIRIFNQAGADLKLGLQPQLPLELAIVESVLTLQARGATPAPLPEPALATMEGASVQQSLSRRAKEASSVQGASPSQAEDGSETGMRSAEETAEGGREEHSDTASEVVAALATRARPMPPPPPPPTFPEEADKTMGVLTTASQNIEAHPRVVEEQIPTDANDRTLDWWHEQWESFKEFLVKQGEDGQRAALRLKFCEPHAVDEDSLTLGFYYSIHKEKIETPRERAVVERSLQAFSGSPLAVHCLLAPKPGSLESAKTKYEEAAEDPVVREAMRHGARIVEVFQGES